MILDTHVKTKWTNRNKTWYEQKGYTWTKNFESLMVKVNDLPPTSTERINVQCDYCGKKFTREFGDILEKIACRKCSGNFMSETKREKRIKENLDNLTIEGDTCYLKINDETEAVFDYEDLHTIIQYKWSESNGYLVTNIKKEKCKMKQVKMHQLIGATGYDHINRDGTDNRKCNLRPATPQQNQMNVAPYEGKSSEYRGVSYHIHGKNYYARIKIKGKTFRIGIFNDEIACANAYNYFAKELFDEYAYLNDVPYMTIGEWKSYRTSRTPIEDVLEQAKRWI